MIASLACLLALADKRVVGEKWQYLLTWHYFGKDINTTDEESFDVEVTKVFPESVTLKVSQKLTATILDEQRIPTDPKAVPATHEWALSPSGSVAFMPNARFGLESRFYRILKGVMPEPKGDTVRDQEWTIEYADDGLGMPLARLRSQFSKALKDGKEYLVGYREQNGTNGIGRFVRAEKTPFPSYLEMKFTNTKMQGGTDTVDCDFTMRLKAQK